jgi:hypothetical protein
MKVKAPRLCRRSFRPCDHRRRIGGQRDRDGQLLSGKPIEAQAFTSVANVASSVSVIQTGQQCFDVCNVSIHQAMRDRTRRKFGGTDG